MKKVMAYLLAVLCLITPVFAAGTTQTAQSLNQQKAILKAFDQLVAQKAIKTAAPFVDQKIRLLNQENADKMMLKYIGLLNKAAYDLPAKDGLEKKSVVDSLSKLASSYNYDYYQLQMNRGKVKDVKTKALLQSIQNRNLALTNAEGSFFYTVNYVNLSKYAKFVSPQMGAFIQLEAQETVKPMSSDGGLVISLDDLIQRITSGEKLLQNYKGTKMEKYAAIVHVNRVWALVYGLDNTPAYDYDSQKYLPEFLKAYRQLAAEPNTKVGTLFTQYLNLIEKHQNKMDDNTRKDIEPLMQAFKASYGIKNADHEQFAKDIFGN